MSAENLPVTRETQGFGVTTAERSAELAAVAVAATAKAEVESAYVMAIRRPRSEDDARAAIVKLAGNPFFAKKARYRKPVGKDQNTGEMKYIEGPSVRFAEAVAQTWGNLFVKQTVIYDDETKRIIGVVAKDLERNMNYSGEVTLQKIVERKYADDRQVLGERTNSFGKKIFIVVATEDELLNKMNANISKMLRNQILRLIPQHIIDEAMSTVVDTIAKKIKDNPDAERNRLVDEFLKMGVKTADIEKLLGHPFPQSTPAELMELGEVLNALQEGSAKWSDYIAEKAEGQSDEKKQTLASAQKKLKEQQEAAKNATPDPTQTLAAEKAKPAEQKKPEPAKAAAPKVEPPKADAPKPEPPKEEPAAASPANEGVKKNPDNWPFVDGDVARDVVAARIGTSMTVSAASGLFNSAMDFYTFDLATKSGLRMVLNETLARLTGKAR